MPKQPPEDDTNSIDEYRRQILKTSAVGTIGYPLFIGTGQATTDTGQTGQSSTHQSTETSGDGEFIVKQNGNEVGRIAPVTDSQSVEEYYNYDSETTSSNTPDDLETEKATITFLYRNTNTDDLSLVTIHGNSETTSGRGSGQAILQFDNGVGGATWKVQDEPHGESGEEGVDDYNGKSKGDTLENGDTVGWRWDANTTDGGAFGPLDETLDIDITHLASGERFDKEIDRKRINRWLAIDGDDIENPLDLTEEEGTDFSARLIGTGSPESTPELTLEDPRLVQIVEDTQIDRDSTVDKLEYEYSEPDPNLIAGRNTTALFDLEVSNVESLPDSVTVRIERVSSLNRQRRVDKDTFELSRSDIKSTQGEDGDDIREVLDGTGFPVFAWEGLIQSVTISIGTDDSEVNGDTVTLDVDYDEAADGDVVVQDTPPLRIGFIDVRDPEGGENYGGEDTGETRVYEETVTEAAEAFAQQYPVTDLRVYRHDTPIRGATDSDGNAIQGSSAFEIDTREARCALDDQVPVEEDDTLSEFSGRIQTFDATVLVVPGGVGEFEQTNPHYYDFHDLTYLGAHPINPDNKTESQPRRSASVLEGQAPGVFSFEWDIEFAGSVTLQEVGHHFELKPYEGPPAEGRIDNPLAQRRGDSPNLEHAAPLTDTSSGRVTSVGLDLRDGTFNAILPPRTSFMSYAEEDSKWADSRIVQELIDGQFNPQPPEATAPTNDRKAILMCTFQIQDDGTVADVSCSRCVGLPMARIPDGDVTVSTQTADGETRDTFQTSPRIGYDTSGGREPAVVEDLVPVTLPFPEEVIAVEVTYEETTTRIDPVSGLLRSAIVLLPEDAFVRRPDERRQTLLNKIDAVKKQMQKEAYQGAVNKLRNDVRPTIQDWIAGEYETASNVKTKSELLGIVDDLISRVDEATSDKSRGNGNKRDK